MKRRLFYLVAAGALALTGCRSTLENAWSFSSFKDHAERLDFELERFRTDVREIFFGLDSEAEHPVVWDVYSR